MKVDVKQLRGKLNPNIIRRLDNLKKYELLEKPAKELLVPERFDLIAKYLYVKYKELNIKSDFAKKLYLEHIKVFNGFFENDGSGKIGEEAFLKSFDDLISSIKREGFDINSIIPLSQGVLLDGAHRVAVSMFFNKEIPCVELQMDPPNYNYAFFEERGLKRDYLDAMAYEYAKLKDNTYIVIIWPTAEGKEKELSEILNSYGKIVYRKDVYLNRNGSVQLIRQVYKRESWIGSSRSNFIGARNKASWCFKGTGPLRVFLFESNNDLVEMKEKIRNMYGVGKHSVHVNDDHKETVELAGLFFNKNSIHWLNNSLLRELSWFERLFKDYKEFIKKEGIDPDNACLVGSATLAAYGIRDVRDIDFIIFPDCLETGFKEIDCHNAELKEYPKKRDEIIFDPDNYFVVDGYKFASLELVKLMKEKRGEVKDKEDLKMISLLTTTGKINVPIKERCKKIFSLSFIKGRIKFQLLKLRYFLEKIKYEVRK